MIVKYHNTAAFDARDIMGIYRIAGGKMQILFRNDKTLIYDDVSDERLAVFIDRWIEAREGHPKGNHLRVV